MKRIFPIIVIFVSIITSCAREGCTDPEASNYQEKATKDNGSCTYPDPAAIYYGQYYVADSLFVDSVFSSISTYTLYVSSNGVDGQLELNYVHGEIGAYYALLDLSAGTFEIPSQTVTEIYPVSGYGSITSSNVEFTTFGDVKMHKAYGHR